jgi:hypothetical protein
VETFAHACVVSPLPMTAVAEQPQWSLSRRFASPEEPASIHAPATRSNPFRINTGKIPRNYWALLTSWAQIVF